MHNIGYYTEVACADEYLRSQLLPTAPVLSPLYCCRMCGVQYLLPADRCTLGLLLCILLSIDECTEQDFMTRPTTAEDRGVGANVAVQW
jgi:hypothetical protein